jgi:hypothetical protein
MRSFLFILLLATPALTVVPRAQAGWGDTFAFDLDKDDPGCIKVGYVRTSYDFPNLDNGVVTSVRFFYSKIGKTDVTENSPFQETRPAEDENGSKTVSPNVFCGFTPGRYFFKYGLYDANDNLLEMMTDDQWNSYSNSIEVEDTP